MPETKLSNVRPDFESLVEDLRSGLGAYDSWEDILPFSAGTAMIEFMAAIGTMLNYSIEKAAQEQNFDTMGIDSSVYRLARTLGVNPNRRYPASVVVSFTVDATAAVIPKYTQFQVDGIDYYNYEEITINPSVGASVDNITLYQGTINTKRYVGTGKAYQVIRFGQNFTASEHFVSVRVGAVEFTRVKHPLWMTVDNETNPFWDTTLPDGSVQLVFGNEEFGTIPEVGSQIFITYAETLGSEANTPESGLRVSLIDTVTGISNLVGTSKTALGGGTPQGGKDADSVDDLKWQAPRLYAAGERAVRREDWRALIISWIEADIIDASVWGEHEERFTGSGCLGPFNMNVVYICPLLSAGTLHAIPVSDTNGNTVNIDKTPDLLAYLEDRKYVNSTVVIRHPEEFPVDLDISVFVFTGVQVDFITSTITTALNKLFSKRRGALGSTHQASDITDVIKSFSQVDYCVINSIKVQVDNTLTTVDKVVLSKIQYAKLNNLNITVQTTERS